MNRGDPFSQPKLMVSLDEDRGGELFVSPYDRDIPWSEIQQDHSGWILDEGDYAYLSYVPEAVEAYRKQVSSLPGFWAEGPSAALELGPEFTMRQTEQLLEAMVGLKEAARGS